MTSNGSNNIRYTPNKYRNILESHATCQTGYFFVFVLKFQVIEKKILGKNKKINSGRLRNVCKKNHALFDRSISIGI